MRCTLVIILTLQFFSGCTSTESAGPLLQQLATSRKQQQFYTHLGQYQCGIGQLRVEQLDGGDLRFTLDLDVEFGARQTEHIVCVYAADFSMKSADLDFGLDGRRLSVSATSTELFVELRTRGEETAFVAPNNHKTVMPIRLYQALKLFFPDFDPTMRVAVTRDFLCFEQLAPKQPARTMCQPCFAEVSPSGRLALYMSLEHDAPWCMDKWDGLLISTTPLVFAEMQARDESEALALNCAHLVSKLSANDPLDDGVTVSQNFLRDNEALRELLSGLRTASNLFRLASTETPLPVSWVMCVYDFECRGLEILLNSPSQPKFQFRKFQRDGVISLINIVWSPD